VSLKFSKLVQNQPSLHFKTPLISFNVAKKWSK